MTLRQIFLRQSDSGINFSFKSIFYVQVLSRGMRPGARMFDFLSLCDEKQLAIELKDGTCWVEIQSTALMHMQLLQIFEAH